MNPKNKLLIFTLTLIFFSLFIASNVYSEVVELQSQTTNNNNLYFGHSADQTYVSSSFISSFTDDVNYITVKLANGIGTPGTYDFTMTVESITSGEIPTNPRDIISTSTNTISSSTFSGSYADATFNFNNLNLTSGTKYAIVLHTSGYTAGENYWKLGFASGITDRYMYVSGSPWSSTSSTQSNAQFYFIISKEQSYYVTPSQTTGTYNNDFNVTLTTTQSGSTGIYYTTDGTDPDITDTEYIGAITIFGTTTLKAVSYDGSDYSEIMDETYTMEVFGTPTADKNAGVYYAPINVALTKYSQTLLTDTGIYTSANNPNYQTGSLILKQTWDINSNLAEIVLETKNDTFSTSAESMSYLKINYNDSTTTNLIIPMYTNYTEVTFNEFDSTKLVDSVQLYQMYLGGGTFGSRYLTYAKNIVFNYRTRNTTLTYTTDGTDPTIASTEYTTPITIAINNDANTTLKFAEFKTGYTSSAIQTIEFDIHDANLHIYFYDENTLAKLDGNVSIVDLTNSETYYADENGLFSQYLTDIDWKEKQINAYVERKVSGVTTHTSRNLQFYWTNEDHDYNFMLLPIDEGENIEFLVKDTNDNLWSNKYVQFVDSDLNLISSNKTDSEGKFTSYLKTDGDYNAVLYDSTGTEGDTYQKTTVNVKKPKNEKSLADISPYDVEVGGLLIYSLSNQSAAQTSINIFGGTTSTYDFTVVDYNADPVDRTYIPRTYNVKNPFGLGYSTTYNLQPYLITKEDGVIPSIVVYDELKTPYPGITVSIFKQIEGTTQLVEQKQTDSTGRTSFVGFPLDIYFVYLYENGTLKGSYEIQVRDSDETFYFVISRDTEQDVVYRGLDLKYSWNNTPEYVDITTNDIDLNLSVYADYLNDFNITSYEIKAYQNNTLKETLTGDLSGTSVTITDSLNRLNYTAGMPVKIVADITFDYAGQNRILNLLKTINVDSKTTGLLTVLKNFPSKVGVLWTIILSILITISILVLFGTSDFVSKDYLMYVGLFILGFFVFIGWFATGVEVFGIDSMWFIYIVTVIASVGFALQDSQR